MNNKNELKLIKCSIYRILNYILNDNLNNLIFVMFYNLVVLFFL